MRSHSSIVEDSVSLCFEACTAAGAVLSYQYSSSLSVVLALILATYLWDSRLAACVERLIEPFCHRVRSWPAGLPLVSACPDPTSTHRLCTLPQNKRESYATPNVRISRTRAPPR